MNNMMYPFGTRAEREAYEQEQLKLCNEIAVELHKLYNKHSRTAIHALFEQYFKDHPNGPSKEVFRMFSYNGTIIWPK